MNACAGKLIAVALLDSTIKLFFTDTLKFFLSLYGHKLPVLSMDISSDSSLLVSGAADKNIKIWGLDFGDCHRSLFAHADSVMQVAFVHNTHYVFTAGGSLRSCQFMLTRPSLYGSCYAKSAEQQCCHVCEVAVLCCAVLCCAVLCCAVLRCAALCCAALCCAVLGQLRVLQILSSYLHRKDPCARAMLLLSGNEAFQVVGCLWSHSRRHAGKDKVVKYWDADKFEHLLTLEGHHSEVWCMALSAHGDFLVTGSHDRSLRRWERTDEPFFVEEEREKRLESLFEADIEVSTMCCHPELKSPPPPPLSTPSHQAVVVEQCHQDIGDAWTSYDDSALGGSAPMPLPDLVSFCFV